MRGLDGEGGGNEDGWDRVDTMLSALGLVERWSWEWAIGFGNENENENGSLSLKRRWTDEPVRKNGYCVRRNVRGSDASDSVSTPMPPWREN